jgi:hypothetical protein
MTSGHLGEWLAQEIFDIKLNPGASTKAIDGRGSSTRSVCSTRRSCCASKRHGGVKIGVASSITAGQWAGALIYPEPNPALLALAPDQRRALDLFRVP